jgi:polyisoprenyl-teichoic acid--peptidoglycan teichoic acid transferase
VEKGSGVEQLEQEPSRSDSVEEATIPASVEVDSVEAVPRAVEPEEPPAAIAAPSRPRQSVKALFWGFTFVVTSIVSATLGAVAVLTTPFSPAIAPPQAGDQFSIQDLLRQSLPYHITRPINVLVMGIDRVPDVPENSPLIFSGRSDTMLLLRIDPTDNTVNVLSIPRDTQVMIPDVGVTKINHANMEGGPGLAARVVSHTLNDVPIDRYVRVSTDAFRELVDLLGGVEVFVPHPMVYDDDTQNLHIDLEQGWQTLNGDQAEQFARFRSDGNGDIGRVQRQQQLIRALRERLTSPSVLPRLPEAIELMQRYIDTNLSLEEMLALVSFGLNLNQDDFRMVMLPGRFSAPDEFIASYWLMDPDGMNQVMGEYFHQQTVGMVHHSQPVSHLRVAVQNASGQPELAHQVATYLKAQGFDNVYVIQDWTDEQRQTQVIAQRGDLEGADRLKNILGLGEVVAASTGDLESDFTIRVGADWQQRSDS